MRFYRLMLILIGISTCYNFTSAQSGLGLEDNRALLRIYSRNEIIEIENLAPAEYNLLELYFTASFQVDIPNCSGCNVDFEELFNYDLFNVTDFEHQRMPDENYSFTFKDKYSITLFSKSWLYSSLNGYELSDLINFRPFREFPTWMNTGDDDEDYATYSEQVRLWILDFPELYRSKSNSGEFVVIRIAEWNKFPQVKREELMNGVKQILIID